MVNEEVAPWLDLVRKLGLLAASLSDGPPVSVSVQVRGELASEDVEVLKLSALRGLFSAVVEGPVTFVNAPALAEERGVTAEIGTASESPNHRSVVDVRAVAHDGTAVNVAGTLSGPQLVEKIVQINGRNFDLRARGINLVINYADQPGALGKIGTLLGSAGSISRPRNSPRTPRARGRRSCCAWTGTCRATCGRKSVRPSAPTSLRWLIFHETRRRQEKLER